MVVDRDAGRSMAFEMRRPTYVQHGYFDVPMLAVKDLRSNVLGSYSPDGVLADCRLLRDVDVQAQLALICVANAKLCE